MAGAGAGVGAGAGAVARTGAVAEPFTLFRSSFVFGSGLSASFSGCSSPGRLSASPLDAPVQGAAFLVYAAPRMFQSRGRHLGSWPRPECSSPGLLAGPPDVPVQWAGPPSCFFASFGPQIPQMLQSRGPFSCFLATPWMFQSRAVVAHHVVIFPSVCSPPDAPVQGAIHLVFARQWQGLGIRWTRVSRRVILLHS